MGGDWWQSEGDPTALLQAVLPLRSHGSASPQTRKSRLYLIACARRAWDRLPWAYRELVEVADRVVDRWHEEPNIHQVYAPLAEELYHARNNWERLEQVEQELSRHGHGRPTPRRRKTDHLDEQTWGDVANLVYFLFAEVTPSFNCFSDDFHTQELIRDVFLDPARSPRLDAAWVTPTVRALAQRFYDSGQLDSGVPILGDALREAGCGDATILSHCQRSGAGHVRGCWLVDLILETSDSVTAASETETGSGNRQSP